MKFHPDVLRCHEQFGGDLEDMQRRYDAPTILEALRKADAAISVYVRYLDGGETRGSYDGKPEREALRKAGFYIRTALANAGAH
ncbi:hypothetical protein ACVDG5_017990 [Mesorhizobium sp. ORM6]